MKEKLISYNTARLAKEKGFNEPCTYWNDGEQETMFVGHRMDSTLTNSDIDNNPFYKRIPFSCTIPTQALLQKWLREKYELELWVQPVVEGIPEYEAYKEYKYIYLGFSRKTGEGFSGGSKNASFEKTLEIGLQEALDLI